MFACVHRPTIPVQPSPGRPSCCAKMALLCRRLFTLEAALELLPRVRELMARAQQQRRDYLAAERQLAGAMQTVRGNGHRADTLRQAEVAATRALRQAQQTVEALQDLGCEVKDLEMGLVDFRSLREGREVYLCWRVRRGDDLLLARA